jgi:hypothetical protein
MIDRDMAAHRMAKQDCVFAPEMSEQEFDVVVERAHHPLFWVVRNTMTPKIQGHDVKAVGERGGDVVPPMRVRTAAVKHHQDRLGITAPGEIMKLRRPRGIRLKEVGTRFVGWVRGQSVSERISAPPVPQAVSIPRATTGLRTTIFPFGK